MNGDGEPVRRVQRRSPVRSSRRGQVALPPKRLILVVQRLVAARAQNRLPQPLEPEHEKQRADDEPQGIDRDLLERRTEHGNEPRESRRRDRDTRQGGAPPPHDAHTEHDRQRLDHLHGARQEGSEDDQRGTRAHVDSFSVKGRGARTPDCARSGLGIATDEKNRGQC